MKKTSPRNDIEKLKGKTKNSPHQASTRASIRRLLQVDQLLKKHKYLSAKQIANELECSRGAIIKDIGHMRLFHNAPIEYAADEHGFYYTHEFQFLPTGTMSESDLFAVLVADKLISQYQGMPEHRTLRATFKKMLRNLDKKKRHSLRRRERAISIRTFGPEDADTAVYAALSRAVVQKRVTEFDYRNYGQLEWMRRTVHPLEIVSIDHIWYLYAYDLLRNDIRTFQLARLKNPALLQEKFKGRHGFDLEEYLEGAFRAMKGKKQYDIELEFNIEGTDQVRPRKWHPSQTMEELPLGCSRVKMHLNSLEEVTGWILSFGTRCRVIGPPELKQKVCDSITGMGQMYGLAVSPAVATAPTAPAATAAQQPLNAA